jgi:uncharacterized membrane protein YbaN (DUF454 family)
MTDHQNTPSADRNRSVVRWVLIALGCLCVALGAVGVFVPGLPTTPLLLLASWLFYKSSRRMQEWLLASPLGVYIREYERRQGMTLAQRVWALSLMTVMVAVSCIFFIDSAVVRIIVLSAGCVGCVVVGFVVPRAK